MKIPIVMSTHITNFVTRFKPEVVINPGDELMIKCVYNSISREEYTYWGDGTFDEMCYGIFTYYPAQDGK